MYNALTHTFQSQRLLRYLIRALTARGSHVEAGKALHLYVDLFDKARETDAAQVARDVRKFRVGSVATEAEKFKEKYRSESDDGHGENGTADVAVDEEDFDIDADREFVETMVFGVRLACKYLEDPKGGLKLAKRARAIFDEGKDKSLVADKLVESRVERALGVALGALASKGTSNPFSSSSDLLTASDSTEADLETRPDDHALALAHLESAVALDPTSWETLYHLSYQLAELRQITPALDAARSAVALNNGSKESWHLLGLLVAAQKDLGASLQVLETALDDEVTGLKPATNGNGDDDDDDDEEVPVRASKNRPRGASFVGRPAPRSNKSTESLVTLETAAAPSKTSSFNAPRSAEANFEYPQDETERLATEVQIRMTKNVVIEAMEGPEAALLDQQSLLAYFSLALATVRDGPGEYYLFEVGIGTVLMR
jgi:tetratricopeptide (TPR) repeat protein